MRARSDSTGSRRVNDQRDIGRSASAAGSPAGTRTKPFRATSRAAVLPGIAVLPGRRSSRRTRRPSARGGRGPPPADDAGQWRTPAEQAAAEQPLLDRVQPGVFPDEEDDCLDTPVAACAEPVEHGRLDRMTGPAADGLQVPCRVGHPHPVALGQGGHGGLRRTPANHATS